MALNSQSKCIAKILSGPRKGEECKNMARYADLCGLHKNYGECLICYERACIGLGCGHIYHIHCIENWFATCRNRNCPYCGKSDTEPYILHFTRSQMTKNNCLPILTYMIDQFSNIRDTGNQIKHVTKLYNTFIDMVVFVKRYHTLMRSIKLKMEELRNDPIVLRNESSHKLFAVFDRFEEVVG